MMWNFEAQRKLPKLSNPILIEGLPGIGNVGKVAVDFIIDKLDAIKIYDITSNTMPHSVFVNEDNMVEMPAIEMYYKKSKVKGQPDMLLLTGDVQPTDEISCHEFCNAIMGIAKKFKVREIITLGGIGLQEEPRRPKVYCTGNDQKMIKQYSKGKVSNQIYGVVGPIIGASGLLLGLAAKQKIPAVTFLAETLSHPLFLGIKGSREILKVLNTKLSLKINLKELDKEIKSLETEMLQKTKELSQITKETALKKIEGKFGKEMTYIG